MTLLSATSVLDAPDLKEEIVEIPEWPADGAPGKLRLLEMDAERTQLFTTAMETHGVDGMSVILIFCAVNEDGALLFTMDDLARMRKKNFRVLDRLQRICLRLNGMGAEGRAILKNA
jgi:hypothetical protein